MTIINWHDILLLSLKIISSLRLNLIQEGMVRIMGKFLFLIIVIMVSSNALAQTPGEDAISHIRTSADAFWKNKVDITTEWGKWLLTTKPYWDQFINVELNTASSLMKVQDINVLPASHDDIIKKMNPVWFEQYKEMKNITPPEEFKEYHAIVLQEDALLFQITSAQQSQQLRTAEDELTDKSNKELHSLFNRHGVPQNIIDGFLKG